METPTGKEPAFGELETRETLTTDLIEANVRALLEQLTLDEKIWMMSGDPGGGYNQHPCRL